MMMEEMKRVQIEGTGISVRGDDIDTDRIIPARYLKCVTFDGLGEHAFEDDRLQLREQGKTHPFDDPEFQGAKILFVNENFGCGSSREHAPQSLQRWGIEAVVGESFAEIFYGNCVSLGVPCVTVDSDTIAQLMEINEQAPQTVFTLSIKDRTLRYDDQVIDVGLSDGDRQQFLEGRWDTTAELLQARVEIEKTAASLPYFTGWS